VSIYLALTVSGYVSDTCDGLVEMGDAWKLYTWSVVVQGADTGTPPITGIARWLTDFGLPDLEILEKNEN
jgi:hypothetical protein